MKIDLPGFWIEKNRSGTPRYRVRVEGKKKQKITLPVGPDHENFLNHYHAARAGEVWSPAQKLDSPPRSLDWLAGRYLDYLGRMVEAGQMSPATLKQRNNLILRACDFKDPGGHRYGEFDMDAPTSAFITLRDEWAATPGTADNAIKSIRAMYRWAMERGGVSSNPTAGIGPINRNSKGATPWTPADIKAFKKAHPKGSTAHLWLTLQTFTACRIGDAIWLGRGQEIRVNGDIWLEWQPRKKGSALVSVPMLPPLYEATRASKIVGPSYILNSWGHPYKTMESLRQRVQRWCRDAGVAGRSSHGIRKAVAELMAEAGCTQHQIMAVMSHTQAKTSEVYTKGAQRRVHAADGIAALSALKW